jgi:hypothetical protein
LWAAQSGHLPMMRWLLSEGGASNEEKDNYDDDVWDHLRERIEEEEYEEDPLDPEELASLLKFMLLLADPPANFAGALKPDMRPLLQEGARLRAALPQYLERRQSVIRDHCPVLPLDLQAVVVGYSELSVEEKWATGLGQATI